MGQEAATPRNPVVEERSEIGGGGGGEEDEEARGGTGGESCEFCGAARALLSCRADSARLCLACDRHVHAANSVSSRHRRAPLCDACRAAPASILCSSAPCRALLCSNCDFDAHGRCQPLHDRRPVEGFSGCPSAAELFVALGVGGEEKEVLGGEGDEVGEYLVEDASLWEAQPLLRLVDLVVPNTASHGFQAMAVPSLPKNRNSTCGKYKEEIILQIRELVKLEGYGNDSQGLTEPRIESYSWVSEQNVQTDYAEPTMINSWIATTIKEDVTLEGNQSDCHEAISTMDLLNPCGEYLGSSSVVNLSSLNEPAEVHACTSQASDDINKDHFHSVLDDNKMQKLPPKGVYEITYPDRNSVLSRYKEKRKTRRYDKLIRYESRKVRADSRLRIKGRFAKMNPSH
ncbi:hypothetical protein Cni_G04714 [Canna indica]|uniref:Zinc finger protein CONSTANS-LIKE 13 n=1 Tax=Canna indica TaxID=4628 RepID=A0AAQ3Q4Q9_9LILI|nr:hypothetical protein Cni_G04714 [Canna indica]